MTELTLNLDCMRHIVKFCDAKTVYNVMLTHRTAANWASTNLADNIVAFRCLIAYCDPSTVINIQMTHKGAVSKWIEGNSLLAFNFSTYKVDGFKLRHERLRQSLQQRKEGEGSEAFYDACSQIHRFNEHVYAQTKWEGKYLDAELWEIFEAGLHQGEENDDSSDEDSDDQHNSDEDDSDDDSDVDNADSTRLAAALLALQQ